MIPLIGLCAMLSWSPAVALAAAPDSAEDSSAPGGGAQTSADLLRMMGDQQQALQEKAAQEAAPALRAPAPTTAKGSAEPPAGPEVEAEPQPEESTDSEEAGRRVSAKRAPKTAVIFVQPDLSFREEAFSVARQVEERERLESMGYLVLEREATDKNVADAIWSGVSAMAYFGHGGVQEGREMSPTFAGRTAASWKEFIAGDFTKRYQLQGLSMDEAYRRAVKRSKNFGQDLVRNYSCFGLHDRSMAHQFVKPGGKYFGAKRWVTTSPIGGAIAAGARCLSNGLCECVGEVSAYELTVYNLPGYEPAITGPRTPPLREPSPGAPDSCSYLDPEGKSLEKGQFYAALEKFEACRKGASPAKPQPAAPKFRAFLFRVWPPEEPSKVSFLLYARIEDTGKPGLFKFPDGSGGWYWRVGEATGPHQTEASVCSVLRRYGQTSVSYNLGWAPHITCASAKSAASPGQDPKK